MWGMGKILHRGFGVLQTVAGFLKYFVAHLVLADLRKSHPTDLWVLREN